jgi:hypothetical protein
MIAVYLASFIAFTTIGPAVMCAGMVRGDLVGAGLGFTLALCGSVGLVFVVLATGIIQ